MTESALFSHLFSLIYSEFALDANKGGADEKSGARHGTARQP